jgi:hypothetical protein
MLRGPSVHGSGGLDTPRLCPSQLQSPVRYAEPERSAPEAPVLGGHCAADGAVFRGSADLLQARSHHHGPSDHGLESGIEPDHGAILTGRAFFLRHVSDTDRPVFATSIQ